MPTIIENDMERTRNPEAPSEPTYEPTYEPMDTSEEPSMQSEADQLPVSQPINSDAFIMAVDVTYEPTPLPALSSSLIPSSTNASEDVTHAMSRSSTNSLAFNSLSEGPLDPQAPRESIYEPRNIYELSDSAYEPEEHVYIPREAGYCSPEPRDAPLYSPSEVQEVPELEPSPGPSRLNPQLPTPKDETDLGIQVPPYGTPISSKTIKRAGPYILGPLIGTSPVKSIVQCLARKEGTDKYFTIKILTLKDENEYETQDDRQGKMLLHAEYSLLSLLQNQDGVVHHHGFFKDSALGEKLTSGGRIYTGRIKRRLCLVLDCLTSHDFNPRNDELLNLQHHVIREKKLSEKESLLIFADTVRIVAELHKRNVVHRDLKLGNIVLNRKTRKVTITNFCLGKHLASEKDLLKDQRGSPAYISPDVLCGKPYLGKPSDMWALGVVLFTMLYGQFPFYDSSPTQLFNKIRAANYHIPNDGRVSEGTTNLIRDLLVLQPHRRLTAVQVLESLGLIIETFKVHGPIGEEEQVVPDISDPKEDPCDKKTEINDRKKLESRPFADLFKKVSFQEQMQQMMNQQQSPLAPRARPFGQIPVHRVDSDPRELTPAELEKYSHLIPRDSQRSHSHGPRREGIHLRTRSGNRYRTASGSAPPPVRQSQNPGRGNAIQNPSNPPGAQAPHAVGLNPVNLNSRAPAVGAWADSSSRDGASTSSSVVITSRGSDRGPDRLHSMLNSGHDGGNSGATPSQNRTASGRPGLPINADVSVSPAFLPESPARAPSRPAPERSENPASLSFRERNAEMARNARMSELRARYDRVRMAMAIRACLLSRNNQRTAEPPRPVALSNRSVPDVDTLAQQSRFREAVLDRLVSFRVRMQQHRIDNIERQMNVMTSLDRSTERMERILVARGRGSSSGCPSLRNLIAIQNGSRGGSRGEEHDGNSNSVIPSGEERRAAQRRVERRSESSAFPNFANALQQLATRLTRPSQGHEGTGGSRVGWRGNEGGSERSGAADRGN
ncbi:serine/threonine-protein kinase BRSK1 [Diachasma alloeum]|uniref:serine/threonine-protein kinase BRSK1 n=1 Tax=Diachasma alloeum TaxID=454923 RepID=UPI0007382A37|nr:serine/threonine-protein kinase BRSK1 [Diachasma alloeum]